MPTEITVHEDGGLNGTAAQAGASRITHDAPHRFVQDPQAETVLVCRCGKWPEHHTHGGERKLCSCDTCRADVHLDQNGPHPMTLDDLLTQLGEADQALVLPHAFNNPHSYRGYYDELAFEPAENITVGDVAAAAWSAMDETFTGYKGGEFTMTGDTTCWMAYEGSSGGEELTPDLLTRLLDAGTRPATATTPQVHTVSDLHLTITPPEPGDWHGRQDVLEALEAAGWVGDEEMPLSIVRHPSGAVWAVANDAEDSGLDCPNGSGIEFPSDVPSVVIIAACLAATHPSQ